MPQDFMLAFDRVHKVLLITFAKAATNESVLHAHEAIRKFVGKYGPCNVVRDYRAATGSITPGFPQHLGSLPALLPPNWRHVIVVAQPVQFGITRQVQALRAKTDGAQYYLVQSLEEAWDGLGITAAEFAPVDL